MGAFLVTGANGNLGQAVVRALTGSGRTVAAMVSPRHEGAYAGRAHVFECVADAADERRADAIVQEVIARTGHLDGFVGTVGGFAAGTLESTGLDDVHRMIRLNFDTAYALARPVVRQFAAQPAGGVLVFIGSRAARHPAESRDALAYALSKSMLIQLAETINAMRLPAVEARVIVPGTIDTPQNRDAMPDADFSTWTPPDVLAGTIVRLLDRQVPGQSTVIDASG